MPSRAAGFTESAALVARIIQNHANRFVRVLERQTFEQFTNGGRGDIDFIANRGHLMRDRIQRPQNIPTFSPGCGTNEFTLQTIPMPQKRQMHKMTGIHKEQENKRMRPIKAC